MPQNCKNETLKGHACQITDDHSIANPGITVVVNELSHYMTDQGWKISVLAPGSAKVDVPVGVEQQIFPLSSWRGIWRYSRGMSAYVFDRTNVAGTIFHLHGVWFAPQWMAARAAFRHAVPAILTPNGMLEPWHWKKSTFKRMKKAVYWKTLAYPAFRRVQVIHAVNETERDNLAKLFPEQRLEVIPNAINLREIDQLMGTERSAESHIDGRYLLFLGRIDPQKGLDILVKGFAQTSQRRGFRMVVVGPESDHHYVRYVKSLVHDLGLDKQVIFVGPVFGNQKWELYRHAWAVCIPSRSEGLSSVQLEAGAAGVPVITTRNAGFTDLQEHGGVLVDLGTDELVVALRQVLSWTERERSDRGSELRRLIERRYSWETVGLLWLQLYTEMFSKYG